MQGIQRPAVILYLRSGEIEGQHHFVFRYGEVQRLLNGLWFHASLVEQADHLVGIPGITAETIPFGEQHQVNFVTFAPVIQQQVLPFRAVESFG
nr:hypothetical protein [Chitinophaga sp. XS-30]